MSRDDKRNKKDKWHKICFQNEISECYYISEHKLIIKENKITEENRQTQKLEVIFCQTLEIDVSNCIAIM